VAEENTELAEKHSRMAEKISEMAEVDEIPVRNYDSNNVLGASRASYILYPDEL